jgi:UDP-glucuronate decarboxylase
MHNNLFDLLNQDAEELVNKITFNDFFNNHSVLLTGASGLLGVNFLAYFAKLKSFGINVDVTGIVHSDYSLAVDYFTKDANIKFLKGNLTDMNFLENLGSYDVVIHAASYGQPGKFMADKIATIKLNTTCTLALFDVLNKGGDFLFISTSEVYSGNEVMPYQEYQIGTTDPSHPRACYIEGKRCGEAITNIYREMGVKASSARLALAYGPGTRVDDQRVINQFIQKALLTKKITLQDMGEALRTYCYVSDAIEIMLNILHRGSRPVYNVGGKSRTSIVSLARIIGEVLNVPVELPSNLISMSDAPEDVSLSLELIKQDFGKTSYLPLSDGLRKTIQWQKRLYEKK